MSEMAIETIYPIDDPRWLEFISSHDQVNIFHHPAWMRVLNRQYGFPVFAFCLMDSNRKIIAGIPFCKVKSITGGRQWISLPFTDYVPLADQENVINEILCYTIEESKKKSVPRVEIRSSIKIDNDYRPGDSFFLHVIPLTTEEAVFTSFKKSRIQRGITRSVKNGLRAEIETTEASLKIFYMLHLMTRKKHGKPIQPKRFFNLIYEEIISKNLGFISLVYKDSKPISAGVFFCFGETCLYKYGASDPAQLQDNPNHLMFWTAIKESIHRGCKIFSMGRTDYDNTGLRSFKSDWGSIETRINYYYYPAVPIHGLTRSINEKIIVPLIKNSPTFVCRMIGETAYKYFPSI